MKDGGDYDLAEAVGHAFCGAPRPAAHNIAPHPCDECVAVTAYLAGRDPFAMDAAALAGCVWDLPLLSDEAKRFYLPAWLLASLQDPKGSDATDALLCALENEDAWQPEGGYSQAQRRVIVGYLEALVEYVDDETLFWPSLQRALERWADWPLPTD